MSYVSFCATNAPANNMTPLGLHVKYPIFLPDLKKKIGFTPHIFINGPNNKFHRYPSSGSLADTSEQMDGHDEANGRFSR
jgi:hypothetical protein